VTAGPRLLDRVKAAIRMRHMSARTEEAYVGWIRRFIIFSGKRHPDEMGEPEVSRFLSALATERGVASSTQNQALAAVLFLYRDVLGRDLDWLGDLVHAKRAQRIPVVLTRAEVACVLSRMDGVEKLCAGLLYGSGLRLLEGLRLRVKDVDFGGIFGTRSTSAAGTSPFIDRKRRKDRMSVPMSARVLGFKWHREVTKPDTV
jgi:site-specific recombinase XerD